MLALPGSDVPVPGRGARPARGARPPPEAREDPAFRRSEGAELGRDGCRVPLPWSGDEPPFGFSSNRRTWLPQPASWAALTAERQEDDPGSMLALYRAALRLRRELPALGDGELTWLESPQDVLAFRREPGFIGAVNLGTAPAPRPAAAGVGHVRLALASSPDIGDVLPPASAAWWVTD